MAACHFFSRFAAKISCQLTSKIQELMNKFYTLLITILGWLSCFSASAQEVNRYFITDGKVIPTRDELTTGYYIISVARDASHATTGMLCWNESATTSHFGINTDKKYSSLTNQALDTNDEESKKYIFYVDVNSTDKTFTIKSISSSMFMSKANAASATSHQYVQNVAANDDNIAKLTLVYKVTGSNSGNNDQQSSKISINGKSHFIVKLANATTTTGGAVYLHSQGSSPYYPFSYYNVHNANGGSCNKLAFFKLRPVASFTYDYQINGESVKTESQKVAIGSEYPNLSTMPAFCSATKPTGTVSEADNNTTKEIPVTWSGKFQYTKTLDNANWYFMKFQNDQVVISNTGEGADIPITTSNASQSQTLSSKELWAFVGNPFDGFQIYNAYKSGEKYGRLVTPTDLNTTSGTEGKNAHVQVSYQDALADGNTDKWVVATNSANNPIANSFFIGIKRSSRNYYLNKNADYLTFWTGGQGNNSAFTVNQDISDLLDTQIRFNNGGDGYFYSTFYADFPIKVNENFVEIYTGTLDEANGRIIMQKAEDGIIPANTGVVIRVPSAKAVDPRTYALTNATPELQKASISGTVEAIPLTDENRGNYLVFSKSGDNLGFFAAGSGITSLAAYKAFLEKPTGLAVRGFKLSFDETTSIDASTLFGGEANTLNPAAPIYDLSGRRVQRTTRGIYIQQGKKVFVK